MRLARTALLMVAGGLLTVAVGILMAVTLFTFTVPLTGGCCPTVLDAATETDFIITPGGVDPWTGEVRFGSVSYTLVATGERVTLGPDRNRTWFIPLPVGFAVGSLLTLTVITRAYRRRKITPGLAVPAARAPLV